MARRWVAALVAGGALVVPVLHAPGATAAGSVRTSVNLEAPTSGTYRTTFNVTGTLWRTGTSTRLVNATVWLQRAVHSSGRFTDLRSGRTDSNGRFAIPVTQTSAYDYRARYGGTATYTAAWSPVRYPAVLQKVSFSSLKTTSWENGTLEARGQILPVPHSGTKLWLQRWNGHTWTNYMSGLTTGSSSFTIRGNVGGSVSTFRLYAPLRYPYAAGASAARSITHYKWRGAFTHSPLGYGGLNSPGHNLTTAAENPGRFQVNLWTGPHGTSWVDVSTAGCTRIQYLVANVTADFPGPTPVRGSVLDNGTVINTTGPLQPGSDSGERTVIRSASRLRFELADAGSSPSATPSSAWFIRALCANT